MKKCVSYWKAGAILAAAVMAAGNVGVTLPVVAVALDTEAATVNSGMQDDNQRGCIASPFFYAKSTFL